MNLLKEIKHDLSEQGLSLKDVVWVGTHEVEIPLDLFWVLANKEYDSSYGAAHVALDLVVCCKNGWLERHEYDGSEWWEFKKFPEKPLCVVRPHSVVDNSFMWCSLKEMNAPGGKYDMDKEWNWDGMKEDTNG